MSKAKPFFILILSLSSLLGGCATTSWKGTPAQFNQADYDTIERVAVLNPRIKFGEGKLKWTLAERDTSPMCVGYYELENRERLMHGRSSSRPLTRSLRTLRRVLGGRC